MPTVWRPIQPYPEAWLIEAADSAYAVRADGWGGWTFTPLSDEAFGRIQATEPDDDEQDEADAVLVAFNAQKEETPC